MDSTILTANQLKRLQDCFADWLPFCSGVLPVTPNDFVVYYGTEENARRMDLNCPSVASLESLARFCEQATLYRGNERKLDSDFFKPMLNVYDVGLIDLIRERLLSDFCEREMIRAKLCNMSVYGEGSFFEAQEVDKPRDENMFGSLVIFYPTAHEGGTFLMRQNGKEWSFNHSNVLAKNGETQLGYVALHHDVEHEVLPITSGYCVTITYNLFFHEAPSLPIPISSASASASLKSTLEALLDDPGFLPDGGHLGFGLEYAYPSHTEGGCNLYQLENRLKGVDADVMRVFKESSLKTSLWVLIDHDGYIRACRDRIPRYECQTFNSERGCDFDTWISEQFHTRVYEHDDKKPDFRVAWVRSPPTDHWKVQSFISYGNAYEHGYAYHVVCLIVAVGKPGSRMMPEIPSDGESDGHQI